MTTTLWRKLELVNIWSQINGTVSDTHTAAPVRADAKHSFPILGLFRSHATGERFCFPTVSTADETPRTPQAEPAKLAQVEVLPQLQEDIPDVQPDPRLKFLV